MAKWGGVPNEPKPCAYARFMYALMFNFALLRKARKAR